MTRADPAARHTPDECGLLPAPLAGYVAGELSAKRSEAVAQHLRECPSCNSRGAKASRIGASGAAISLRLRRRREQPAATGIRDPAPAFADGPNRADNREIVSDGPSQERLALRRSRSHRADTVSSDYLYRFVRPDDCGTPQLRSFAADTFSPRALGRRASRTDEARRQRRAAGTAGEATSGIQLALVRLGAVSLMIAGVIVLILLGGGPPGGRASGRSDSAAAIAATDGRVERGVAEMASTVVSAIARLRVRPRLADIPRIEVRLRQGGHVSTFVVVLGRHAMVTGRLIVGGRNSANHAARGRLPHGAPVADARLGAHRRDGALPGKDPGQRTRGNRVRRRKRTQPSPEAPAPPRRAEADPAPSCRVSLSLTAEIFMVTPPETAAGNVDVERRGRFCAVSSSASCLATHAS